MTDSGEPTLFSRLDELILVIKEITNIPVAVLTNGSLLWLPEVIPSALFKFALNILCSTNRFDISLKGIA